MSLNSIRILLADDDKDDCVLFKDALDELPIKTELMTVCDGEQLMKLLLEIRELPSVLFLDLNMPRKNGLECLLEIKVMEKLKQLPIVIFSTSFDHDIVTRLHTTGAQYYICKPNEFDDLKEIIHVALTTIQSTVSQPSLENFVLRS